MVDASEFVELFLGDNDEECKKTFTGLATVVLIVENKVKIRVDGERNPSEKLRRMLSSYNPKENDRVLVFRDVVLGKIK